MNKIKIEKLDHQGRGIGYQDGKTFFVFDALPGEIVLVESIFCKKNIVEAKVIEYINKSPQRVTPICPYYEVCGGCDLMHLSYQDQLDYKKNKVKEILNRYASYCGSIKQIVESKEYFYRNKVTFQVGKTIGFYQKKSYELIPIDFCYLVKKEINDMIPVLKQLDLAKIKQIVVHYHKYSMIVIDLVDGVSELDVHLLKQISDCVVVKQGKKYIQGKDISVEEQLGNFKFDIYPEAFFQVNTNQAYLMYQLIQEQVQKKGKVLDLYCGTGTIGLFVSKGKEWVIGIERNQDAVKSAMQNKDKNHILNIDFQCIAVEDWIDSQVSSVDVIIVDPPRSGLDGKTKKALLRLNAKQLIYVSCDPMTLARDLKDLSSIYDIKEVTLFDMFPQTYHVESVCVLERC